MDCPWPERGAGKIKRGADKHYPTLTPHEIVETIQDSRVFLPANDAHLWTWATSTHLESALYVIKQLGFVYKTQAAWVKTKQVDFDPEEHEPSDAPPTTQIGLGQYLRGSHELLLFSTRGKGQSPDAWHGSRSIPSVFFAPRTAHSKKPDAAFDLIERVSKGPRLEMFARTGRTGWVAWGNQVNEGKDQ